MPGFSFQSLFNEDPERQLVSGPGATSEWRIKPRSLMDEDADPRFPAFQQAWKQGADVGDLFGPEPFKLQGAVSPSGGDNTRADVAKVQTLLGKAGYLDLGQDGPSGYANPNTDKAIRDFQKDNGLQVDGVLKPNGPTIAKLGGLLSGGMQPDWFVSPRKPFDEKPDVPDIRTPPTFPEFRPQPNGTRKPADLLSILLGEAPEPTVWSPQSTPRNKPQGGKWTDIDDPRMYLSDDPRKGGITGILPQANGADLSTTATNTPFGSADGADHWAAGNMAQALLGRSDYADAVTHFRGEIGRNRAEAMPYLASVHLSMNEKTPELAAKFAGETQKAGLAETPKPETGGNVLSLPIPSTVTPGPVPPANPGETDIRIPAEPKPEPEKKPEGAAVPAASTTTPAPTAAPPDIPKPGAPAQSVPTTEDTQDRTPVQRDAEVLKDPTNVPGYTKWLAEGAKKDPRWAEQHAKDVSREVYKTDPQAAEEMVRQGEKAGVKVGVKVGLYADGHQAGKTADAIIRDAKGGWVSSGPDADSKECVALVKATVPELQGKSAKTDWRKGEDFKAVGDPPIKPGTALANGWDKNGKYPSKSTGNHALVYYGPNPQNPSEVIVVDQYAPKNGKTGQPATRHSWPAERLQGYSVIRVK